MMRNRNKKALYELVGRAGFDVEASKTLEPLHPATGSSTRTGTKPRQQLTRWPKRHRMFQVNGGRLEISVPYQLAVAALMVLVLLFLVVFRLGENTAQLQAGASVVDLSKSVQDQIRQSMTVAPEPVKIEKATRAAEPKKIPVSVTGSNRIVIQTYPLRAHLEPVKQYFAENGIATEIRKIGDRYFLVTANKYQNPERSGTDGYAAKQKIIELGTKYKAPPMRETFGTRPFYDAYGMKFDD